jgi:hypothetical protein
VLILRPIETRAYWNATLCQNFEAIGEGLSEIKDFEQTNIYIFIYIDLEQMFAV